jgi:hypothetical protein
MAVHLAVNEEAGYREAFFLWIENRSSQTPTVVTMLTYS